MGCFFGRPSTPALAPVPATPTPQSSASIPAVKLDPKDFYISKKKGEIILRLPGYSSVHHILFLF